MTITNVTGAPASGAADTPVLRQPFTFTGSGKEYFGIWIVNVLLTIVTLGIYSAWAKVRSTRYFYDNTHLAGSSFEYHGNPRAILKGRVIAFALLAMYQVAARFSVTASLIGLVLLGAIGPWLVWKSLQFKLANSSYRGLRFHFADSVGGAYVAFLLMPLVTLFTLGLALPWMTQRIKKFQHGGACYGQTRLSFSATAGRFYKAYLWASLAIIGVSILLFALVFGLMFGVAKGVPLLSRSADFGKLAAFLPILFYLPLVSASAVGISLVQNVVWNHSALGPHRFACRMQWWRLAGLYLGNMLAIVLTLGLFTPFARIRVMRYRVQALALEQRGSLDAFTGTAGDSASAVGEGAVDLIGFDLAL